MNEAFQAPPALYRNIIALISSDDSEVRHDDTSESFSSSLDANHVGSVLFSESRSPEG